MLIPKLGYYRWRGVSGSGAVYVRRVWDTRSFPRWHLIIDEYNSENVLVVALHLDFRPSSHQSNRQEYSATGNTRNNHVYEELGNILKILRYDTRTRS